MFQGSNPLSWRRTQRNMTWSSFDHSALKHSNSKRALGHAVHYILLNQIWSRKRRYLASEHQGMNAWNWDFVFHLPFGGLYLVGYNRCLVLQRSTSGSGGFGLSHRKYLHGEATTWRAAEFQFRSTQIGASRCYPNVLVHEWSHRISSLRGIGTAIVFIEK